MPKNTFSSRTFRSKTFASGTFTGVGIAPSAPFVGHGELPKNLVAYIERQREEEEQQHLKRSRRSVIVHAETCSIELDFPTATARATVRINARATARLFHLGYDFAPWSARISARHNSAQTELAFWFADSIQSASAHTDGRPMFVWFQSEAAIAAVDERPRRLRRLKMLDALIMHDETWLDRLGEAEQFVGALEAMSRSRN